MIMGMKKYAVFTMDVEAFTDTECVANASQNVEVDLLDGFDEYMRILDKHNIKSTLFTVGSLAPKIADRLRRNIENGHRLALQRGDIPPRNSKGERKVEKHLQNRGDRLSGTVFQHGRQPPQHFKGTGLQIRFQPP